MEISSRGIDLIKQFEGCRLTAYPDPKTGGAPWTIGYGWTGKVGGVPVGEGMTITQQTADQLLVEGVSPYEAAVNELVTVPLTQNQFDALVSFTYNLGRGNLSRSTLLKKLNNKDYDGAANELLRWVSPGTNVERGLRRRRNAERDLFLSA